ncbi:MAG TPA: hypothetical protein VGM05_12355 [Planctomycetaceae bacterium]|jgi:hypothetical protein
MAERPIEQLTLREMFTNAELLIRDLEDHLRNSFHPKSRAAEDAVRSHNIPAERDEIPDSAIRHHVAALFGSNDYSESLFKNLDNYLAAIEKRSQEAIQMK